LDELVLANHILAHEGVLDGFGHVSLRHPEEPGHSLISCSLSPENVSKADLQRLAVVDGRRIAGTDRPSYAEVSIHGAIYRARPDVMAVVHDHSSSIIPFGVTGAPLRPTYHMGSVIGTTVPVWDIADEFGVTDMLVRTNAQGDSLARRLGPHRVTLMRGHGGVVVAAGLREAVFTAVYLERNAEITLASRALGPAKELSDAEVVAAMATLLQPLSQERAWQYWRTRVERTPAGPPRSGRPQSDRAARDQ